MYHCKTAAFYFYPGDKNTMEKSEYAGDVLHADVVKYSRWQPFNFSMQYFILIQLSQLKSRMSSHTD